MTRIAWRGSVACVIGAMLVACGKREDKAVAVPPPTAPPPPVVTNAAAVTPKPVLPEMPALAETIATIKGGEEIPVKAPLAGYLVRQVYKDDALVKTGDLLFLLDARPGAGAGEWTRITSPAPGAVAHARHGAGDWVRAQEELAAVAEIDNVKAELTLPGELARKFQAYLSEPAPAVAESRQNIELILPDGSTYPQNGIVANVVASGNVNTLEIDFPNPGHVLRPGEFVRVRGKATPESSPPASPDSR